MLRPQQEYDSLSGHRLEPESGTEASIPTLWLLGAHLDLVHSPYIEVSPVFSYRERTERDPREKWA